MGVCVVYKPGDRQGSRLQARRKSHSQPYPNENCSLEDVLQSDIELNPMLAQPPPHNAMWGRTKTVLGRFPWGHTSNWAEVGKAEG